MTTSFTNSRPNLNMQIKLRDFNKKAVKLYLLQGSIYSLTLPYLEVGSK